MQDVNRYNNAFMVKIDGEKVRRLRETQGLTQLYLATAVGVTTDTISRWENRRYPTIKRENAVKLASVLGVTLEDILEQDKKKEKDIEGTGDISTEDSLGEGTLIEPSESRIGYRKRSLIVLAALLSMLIFAGLIFLLRPEQRIEISASRYLPPHCPPGQSFPVIITVDQGNPTELALILKEKLPLQCIPLKGFPEFTTILNQDNEIKWISKGKIKNKRFCYLAKVRDSAPLNRTVFFNGDVTIKKGTNLVFPLTGNKVLEITPYHWADTNSDGKIDDNEILDVYDRLGDTKGVALGLDEVKRIWSRGGYRWDPVTKKFILLN